MLIVTILSPTTRTNDHHSRDGCRLYHIVGNGNICKFDTLDLRIIIYVHQCYIPLIDFPGEFAYT